MNIAYQLQTAFRQGSRTQLTNMITGTNFPSLFQPLTREHVQHNTPNLERIDGNC